MRRRGKARNDNAKEKPGDDSNAMEGRGTE